MNAADAFEGRSGASGGAVFAAWLISVSRQQRLQRSVWKKYLRLLKYSELTPTRILSHLLSDALLGYAGLASTAQATPR